MFKTIYLTGAPAAGKSSTVRLLKEAIPSLAVWEYGERLTEYLKARNTGLADQADLRQKSAAVVTPEDVQAVDKLLLGFVETSRDQGHVIIDSHAVTKENYGFRVTAFSSEQLMQLKPDEIWVLYAAPEITLTRISEDPGGRPEVSAEEARMHTFLQASVATSYGIATGKPVYLFDADRSQKELVSDLVKRLKK